MVTISVKDTGLGMDSDQIEKIFDEFYKVDDSRHQLDSSGLGLTITKKIVEKHGGRIWVESEGKDKGSTFYFTLKKVDINKKK
jgi:signal transduction histidine kinase